MAIIHTTCRLCLVRCGMIVETQDENLPIAVGDGIVPGIKPVARCMLCRITSVEDPTQELAAI